MKFKPERIDYFKFQLPWQVLLVIIFVLSSIPQQDMPEFTEKISDKLLHLVVFGLLGLLLYRGLMMGRQSRFKKYAAGYAILFTSVYGILDELHQKLVPGRHPSLTDWLADTAGAIVFILLFHLLRYKTRYRKNAGSLERSGSATYGSRAD